MKIRRHIAVMMYQQLGTMALGHLDNETLEAVIDNFNAFRKVAEDFDTLKEELHKRLYVNVADEKKATFFNLVAKYEAERDMEKREAQWEMMQRNFADLLPIYEKHLSVIVSLANKEVDIELTEVDEDEFIKGVVKGAKDAPVLEIRAAFAPMFKKAEKKNDDFSELDELLK